MKELVLPKNHFEGVTNPQFEEGWDYCLVTPTETDLEMTYFNIDEINVIRLKESVKEINITLSSVLFCMTKQSEVLAPNLGCPAASKA